MKSTDIRATSIHFYKKAKHLIVTGSFSVQAFVTNSKLSKHTHSATRKINFQHYSETGTRQKYCLGLELIAHCCLANTERTSSLPLLPTKSCTSA